MDYGVDARFMIKQGLGRISTGYQGVPIDYGVGDIVNRAIHEACTQIGKPFSLAEWPAGCLDSMEFYDSPRLIYYAYTLAGIELPLTFEGQVQSVGTTFMSVGLSKHSFIPGDLIFYSSTSYNMVGLYMGDDFVLSVRPSGKVKVFPVEEYGRRIIASCRPTVSLEMK